MLNGLRVLELATYIAAPSAGVILADWGADVVKIEPPAGDPMRQFFANLGRDFGANPVFDVDNRGKRSIVIDTSKPQGADLVRRLARDADVLLTNVRMRSLRKSGLDYDSLIEVNPRLVYASVSGYGLEGPDADRPGFDMAAFWARAGVAHLITPKGQEPIPLRTAFGDHITGVSTAAGILAALYERARTGKGRLVETSLLRSGVFTVGSDMAIQLRLGRLASSKPRDQAVNPLANPFKSRDGHWMYLVPRQAGKDWEKLARALGREELAEDPRFATSRLRRENGAALVALLDQAFGAEDMVHWAERLDAEDLVWAPVQTAAEVVADPQAEAAGAFCEVAAADGAGTYRAPASPARFHGIEEAPFTDAPASGQHTDEVLREAGLTPEEIAALGKAGVLGGKAPGAPAAG